jgi:hypothetical protein
MKRIRLAPGDWTRFEEFAKEQGLTVRELAAKAVKGVK